MHSHASDCVNLQKSLTPPVALDTCPRSLGRRLPSSLFFFFLPATVQFNASESNYPIYMQNDTSDAFVTAAEMGDKDGQESRAEPRGRWMEGVLDGVKGEDGDVGGLI